MDTNKSTITFNVETSFGDLKVKFQILHYYEPTDLYILLGQGKLVIGRKLGADNDSELEWELEVIKDLSDRYAIFSNNLISKAIKL